MPARGAAPDTSSGLHLLTSPDATDLLVAALDTAGGRLVDWRVSQVDHRPGHSTTVAYRAEVEWVTGTRTETLGASVRDDDAGADAGLSVPGLITLSDGTRRVTVWSLPHDPDLPALRTALDPASLRRLLASFGLDGSDLRTRVVAYRPRRRAVVRVSAAGARLYLKVLPAQAGGVAALHARHRLLHDAGVPVPPSLGWTDDGLLVLEALPGTGLRSLLRAGSTSAPVPTGEALIAVLDRFPAAVNDLPRRTAWADQAPRYAEVLADVLTSAGLPGEAERARALAAAVTAGLAGCADADGTGRDDVPTHGDFYEAQLLIGSGGVAGLLDVDTAGPGRRADDLACALAHLHSLALADAAYADRALALATAWQADFERTVDADELRLRTAGTLIALATGPHRTQSPTWQTKTVDALTQAQTQLTPSGHARSGYRVSG